MNEIVIEENQASVLLNGVPAYTASEVMLGIFEKTSAAGISVDMISNAPSASDSAEYGFTFPDADMPGLLAILGRVTGEKNGSADKRKPKVMISCGHVKFVIKSDMETGFAERVFRALKNSGCTPLLTSSGISEISLLVSENSLVDLKTQLEKEFDRAARTQD